MKQKVAPIAIVTISFFWLLVGLILTLSARQATGYAAKYRDS